MGFHWDFTGISWIPDRILQDIYIYIYGDLISSPSW